MRGPQLRFAAFGVIGAAAVIAACDADRAISSQQTGNVAYGAQFVLNASGTPSYNFPRGSVRFRQRTSTPANPLDSAITDTIVVTLQGLDTLEAGFYTVWAGNRDGTKWKRLTGDITVIRFDTTLNSLGDPVEVPKTFGGAGVAGYSNQAAFQRGGARERVTFRTTRTQSTLAETDTVAVVVVSIEGSNAAPTAPNPTRRPLWAFRGTTTQGQSVTRALSFGNFSFKAESLYTYIATGRGRAFIRGKTIVVTDSGLGQPPIGYYYAAWAVRRDTFYVTRAKTAGSGVDTVSKLAPDTLYLGAQSTPYPDRKSLFNADSVIVDPNVQLAAQRSILSLGNRFELSSIAEYSSLDLPLMGFQFITVTLESKDADAPGGLSENQTRMGPAILLQAPVPAIVRNGNSAQ